MPDARKDAGTDDEGDDDDAVVVTLGDEDDAPDDERDLVVDVWTCNLTAVRVFQLCTVRGIGAGMGGVWWQGIEIAEIRSACELLKIPHEDCDGVTWDVRYMGRCVANVRNQKAAAAAKKQR